MTNYKLKIKNGFTLIELLVVISIIGILVSLIAVSYTHAQRQARDTQRKSDLKQYQTALENWSSSNNNIYPNRGVTAFTMCSAFLLPQGYIAACPKEVRPAGGGRSAYAYYWTTDFTHYVLYAQLETKVDTYWVVCGNGKSGEFPSATRPFATNGVCPI